MSGISRPSKQLWTKTVTADLVQMQPNEGYIIAGSGGTNCLLPAVAEFGDLIEIVGYNQIYNITQNAGQIIRYGLTNVTTTGVGAGYQTSDSYTYILLKCVVPNTVFMVVSSQGSFSAFAPAPPVGPYFKANQLNSTKPVIRFTGGEYLRCNGSASALYGINISIFAVLRYSTANNTTWTIQYMPSADGPYDWLLGANGGPSDSYMNFYAGTSDPSQVVGSYNVANNTAFLQTIIYDGAVHFRHNASSDGSGTPSYGTPTGDLQDHSSLLTVGGLTSFGGSSDAYFDLAELIIYNEAVSNGDRDSIEGYLNNKFGLGSGSPFNAATVSGCVSWFRTDEMILTDGDSVTFWPDLIGGGDLVYP
jgi:hypothetical protein